MHCEHERLEQTLHTEPPCQSLVDDREAECNSAFTDARPHANSCRGCTLPSLVSLMQLIQIRNILDATTGSM